MFDIANSHRSIYNAGGHLVTSTLTRINKVGLSINNRVSSSKSDLQVPQVPGPYVYNELKVLLYSFQFSSVMIMFYLLHYTSNRGVGSLSPASTIPM